MHVIECIWLSPTTTLVMVLPCTCFPEVDHQLPLIYCVGQVADEEDVSLRNVVHTAQGLHTAGVHRNLRHLWFDNLHFHGGFGRWGFGHTFGFLFVHFLLFDLGPWVQFCCLHFLFHLLWMLSVIHHWFFGPGGCCCCHHFGDDGWVESSGWVDFGVGDLSVLFILFFGQSTPISWWKRRWAVITTSTMQSLNILTHTHIWTF